jgi:hypothetical protein
MSDTNKQYTIRLTLEDGKTLTANLNQIGSEGEKTFVKLQTSAISTDAALSKLGNSVKGSLLAFAAPAAIAASFTGALDSMKELQETSEKIKMPTDEIQELDYAAVQVTGTSQSMNEALLTFTQNLGQAQTGLGRFLPVLKDFGIEYKGLSNEDVLDNVIEAIKNAKSASDALFISQKAFGDGPGQQLVTLWRQGADGLNAYADAAHNAGDVIDTDLVNKSADAAKKFDQMWYDATQHFKGYIAETVSNSETVFEKLSDTMNSIHFNGLKISVDSNDFEKSMSAGPDAYAQGVYSKYNSAYPPEDQGGNGNSQMTDDQRKQEEARQKQIADLKFSNSLMGMSNVQQEIANALAKNHTDINSAEGQQIVAQIKLKDELNNRQKLANDLAQDFSTAIQDAVLHSKNLNDILSSLGSSIESQLFKAGTAGLTDLGSSFIKNTLQGFGFADGGVMTKDGPIPLRKYSSGGIATSPQMAIYGEGSSPEAYVPVPSGKIPVQISGGMGSGPMQVSVTVVNQTSAPVQATAQISSGGNVKVFLTEVVNNMITGGKLNKSMAAMFGIKPVLN